LPGTGAGISGGTNAFDEILKATPPAVVAFLANLPAVDGNFQYFSESIF
jgi:cleavage stimulation factor subunit 3